MLKFSPISIWERPDPSDAKAYENFLTAWNITESTQLSALSDNEYYYPYNPHTPSGGVIGSGAARFNQIFRPTVSGGSRASGTPTLRSIFRPTVSGGSRASGTPTLRSIFRPTVSGGSRASGVATVEVVTSITVDALGVTANGESIVEKTIDIEIQSSGIALGGESYNLKTTTEYAESGGLISGEINPLLIVNITAESGASVVGYSNNAAIYNLNTESGVIINGDGEYYLQIAEITIESFGVLLSGSTDISSPIDLFGEGGMTASGEAISSLYAYHEGLTNNEMVSGEALIHVIYKDDSSIAATIAGSAADVNYDLQESGDSGVIISGSSLLSKVDTVYVEDGEFLISGDSLYGISYEDISVITSIIAGSTADVDYNIQESGDSGVIISGSGSLSRIDTVYVEDGEFLISGESSALLYLNPDVSDTGILASSHADISKQIEIQIEPIGATTQAASELFCTINPELTDSQIFAEGTVSPLVVYYIAVEGGGVLLDGESDLIVSLETINGEGGVILEQDPILPSWNFNVSSEGGSIVSGENYNSLITEIISLAEVKLTGIAIIVVTSNPPTRSNEHTLSIGDEVIFYTNKGSISKNIHSVKSIKGKVYYDIGQGEFIEESRLLELMKGSAAPNSIMDKFNRR